MGAQGAANEGQEPHDSLGHLLSDFQPEEILQSVSSAVGSTTLKGPIQAPYLAGKPHKKTMTWLCQQFESLRDSGQCCVVS